MRLLIALLLFALLLFAQLLLSACYPIMPVEALAQFAPDRLPLTQHVAAAFQPATAESPFVILYPELRTTTAPIWLRAGTRVTYRLDTASFARTRDDPTPSGTGLLQYDVIAKNRRNVVSLSSILNTAIPGTAPVALAHQIAIAGTGDFWFSPRVLANAESAASATFQVTRMPMTVEGTVYQVVRMQSNTNTNAGSGEEVWAFDVDTGLLVFYRQALYRGDGSQSSGTTATLLARRQLAIPWRNGRVPSWVNRGVAWQFAGTQTLDVGVPPGTSLPMTSNTRISAVGALWSEHTQQAYLYGYDAGNSTTATGTMQLFGGYWLPAAAIEVLENGMVLDRDPLTGIQVSVVQANRQIVVLAAEGPGHLTQLSYRVSDGKLIGIYRVSQTSAATETTSLEAVD